MAEGVALLPEPEIDEVSTANRNSMGSLLLLRGRGMLGQGSLLLLGGKSVLGQGTLLLLMPLLLLGGKGMGNKDMGRDGLLASASIADTATMEASGPPCCCCC